MRILVCGGRKYDDYKKVHDVLLPYLDWGLTIIEGGATGADDLAGLFCQYYGVHHQTFKADWEAYGKAAGMIRNRQMLKEGKPDLVIAFPGGKGTANMVDLARKAKVEVIEIDS